MSGNTLNRRQTLSALGLVAGSSLLPQTTPPKAKNDFTLCLNLSTIRGQQLGFAKELEVASKAGFRSVEIWVDSLQKYLTGGGTVATARKLLADLGLQVENAIGFAQWIVDDEATRTKGLDQLKREMELLAQIGCRRIAAPPMGATQGAALDLQKAAERYRTILEMSDQTGVIPHLEMWGFSKNLSRVGEVLYVATESHHPSARLLLDVYHLHKGGSPPESLKFVGKPGIEIFHLNDYPATPAREAITDADRVYPGDGIAPIRNMLKMLKNPEQTIILSLELFNKTYFAQDPLLVAKTGLERMKAVATGV
ncbi:sugar phosphate isomerase/epimerase family protein [Tellurirhabdus bombi]|uniref:sugar phosphate isomerase/epimerase family protein n=1 Tax=Tellurirhabdus bombi TaxID=2907205 RepID=UPI001F1FD67B|nr:sugar phosphate isomerase/epimerase family protein [Tellurirhabdus bombi]